MAADGHGPATEPPTVFFGAVAAERAGPPQRTDELKVSVPPLPGGIPWKEGKLTVRLSTRSGAGTSSANELDFTLLEEAEVGAAKRGRRARVRAVLNGG